MVPINELVVLYIIFQLKHYLADYLWQNEYMLGKFKRVGYILPLSAHCGVHAVFTAAVALAVNPAWAIPLALADFVLHFAMDRVKASPDIWGKYRPHQRRFWLALGFDQMFHHLTHFAIIMVLLCDPR